jgi:RHH-type proline utilization regulon transcriptional repressor/proline dehydrogenase/delta 1-pyrroline-5-carboxylate dehydrogenase
MVSPLSAVGDPVELRAAIAAAYRADETAVVEERLGAIALDAGQRVLSAARAHDLIAGVRARAAAGGVEKFLQEYQLSTPEGVVLVCMAEALLRIPDAETADRLIRDKLGHADWEAHLGRSQSILVNASTWALMLTGRVVALEALGGGALGDQLARLVARSGEPLIRTAIRSAMRILGRQFVMGRTIEEALARAAPAERDGYRHSYDMLGEAARTAADAARYLVSYRHAIAAIGAAAGQAGGLVSRPNLSVKLSALHPRYEFAQADRVGRELGPRLLELAVAARAAGIGLTIDAEESDRLEPSLDLIEQIAGAPELAGWDGLGLAVQAYQKRALPVLRWVENLGARHRRRVFVRLVKGAYWDTEIKRAQERGLAGYPVFTRKASTDVSYLACAEAMLASPHIYPAFATHNALTLATVLELAGERRDYEFQRLHGMGEALYEQIVGPLGRPCRVYAPVGSHEDLLSYLVRRLLENGANTSFVNQVADPDAPIDALVRDPVATVAALPQKPHPRIPLPRDLFGSERRNARGIDLTDATVTAPLLARLDVEAGRGWSAAPVVDGSASGGAARPVRDPALRARTVGHVVEATPSNVESALAVAAREAADWSATDVDVRARCLERAADLLEAEHPAFMGMAVREAGKTVSDAVGEVREAVDFCRYYAVRAREAFASKELSGPTGESNRLNLAGRGVFACISPWNFPLSIFMGQVAAALVAGNPVLAKPAPQTPLIAAHAVRVLHRAGIPPAVLQLLPGGAEVGRRLVADPRLAGVAFTGSTASAQAINRALAARDGPIATLIAETGGQNALIADSSALPEQVIADVLTSSFNSAGQRCSACRVLFVQQDVAPRVLDMLAGAMAELAVGDPGVLATDVGPVIDEAARDRLFAHIAAIAQIGRVIARTPMPPETATGCFVAPVAIELDRLDRLDKEVFGPVLHVVRFAGDRLDQVVDAINATGYGLTLGIHSRINTTVDAIIARARVGNVYVNRSMIGAVVGVQPFGGEGLSGTGPKAGGPHYLPRFATERSVSVDTTSAGGNASLLSLGE